MAVYHTPCAKDLVEAYDEARDRVGTLDAGGQAAYASKCGAGIFAAARAHVSTVYRYGSLLSRRVCRHPARVTQCRHQCAVGPLVSGKLIA